MKRRYRSFRIVVTIIIMCCIYISACSRNSGENQSEAEKSFGNIVEASGGEKALVAVKNMELTGNILINTRTGNEKIAMRMVFSYPDKALLELNTAAGAIQSVINKEESRLRAFSMDRPLPEKEFRDMKNRLMMSLIWILQNLREGEVELEPETLTLTDDKIELQFAFEESNVKMVCNSKTWYPEEFIIIENNISSSLKLTEYREVNGMKLPFHFENQVNNRTVSRMIIDTIVINRNIDTSLFDFK